MTFLDSNEAKETKWREVILVGNYERPNGSQWTHDIEMKKETLSV
jgi:hypothetical protein